MPYPHVRVEGAPRERGRQYGEQARERIRGSVAAYEEIFAHLTGWSWQRVREEARLYAAPIEDFEPRYLEELRGLAEGAALPLEDALALNVRTEVMFAATARQAADARRPLEGCTAFAVLPEASADGHTLVGQNWDWLPHAFETVVVLEARQDEGPAFVSVVEAGLLAKSGLNAAGLGLVVNALVTDADVGEPGVPFHVLLRALLDATTLPEALETLQRRRRSSSANYLLAVADGMAVDVEAAPGDFTQLHLLFPEDGVLVHANHFLSAELGPTDLGVWMAPSSPFRRERLRSALAAAAPAVAVETAQAALRDHANLPGAVCQHPDLRKPRCEQGASVASLVMDLDARRLWLCDGNPCEAPPRELDLRSLLGEPAGAPAQRSRSTG